MGSVAVTQAERLQSYFADPARYSRHNYRIAARAELVREILRGCSGLSILDFGCGDGSIVRHLAADNEIMLVDASPAMLALAARNVPAAARRLAHAENFQGCGRYDLVLCLGLIAHVPDPRAIIASCADALKPGGRLILQLSEAEQPINMAARFGFRLMARISSRRLVYGETRGGDVAELLAAHGLRITARHRHLLLVPPMQHFLGAALVPFDRFVRRRSWLSRQGGETLLVCEKS